MKKLFSIIILLVSLLYIYSETVASCDDEMFQREVYAMTKQKQILDISVVIINQHIMEIHILDALN
jgi:hypothetical protein